MTRIQFAPRLVPAALAVLVTMTTSALASAQENTSSREEHLSVGFELNSLHSDFGLGGQVTSPFFGGAVAFRLRGGVNWASGVPFDELQSSWAPYGSLRLGVVAVAGKVNDFARFYGEGGTVMLLPGSDVASGVRVGGYGIFGFEFLTAMGSPVAYFLEAGGIGTGARATEFVGQPVYANGFLMTVGMHWYPY